ncbi:hypothetical protein BH11BAC2_BH11BAC2_09780 [soil metagenome]
MNNSIKETGTLTRVLLFAASIFLLVSIFTPIWIIELSAPQYPEGLALKIYSNKLGGEVEIINGLNHYIGMKTLHAEEFIEFTVLPYIIGAYALACLLVLFSKKKKMLYFLFGALVIFGIVAMADFWRWEYNYGHNLNPNAAIIVPGMAYQPPLIGYKQLLNFGAYSIPDIGGWLILGSGILLMIGVLLETGILHKRANKMAFKVVLLPIILLFNSCENNKPEAIHYNSDNCLFCGMTISDPKFSAEIVTAKGRILKFDDIICLHNYNTENKDKLSGAQYFVSEYSGKNDLQPAESCLYTVGGNLKSPMSGNTAAFINSDSCKFYTAKYQSEIIGWASILK